MTTLYGIPNCDTVKKARAWLEDNGVAHQFHDYKKYCAPAGKLGAWCDAVGWEKLLNRAGTTFRKLPDEAKSGLDESRATALMLARPSLIKRPIVEHGGGLLVGFDADSWAQAFGR